MTFRQVLREQWAPIAMVAVSIFFGALLAFTSHGGARGCRVTYGSTPEVTAEPIAPAPCCSVGPDFARARVDAAGIFKRLGAELDGEIVCLQFAKTEWVDCSALVSGHLVTLTCNAEGCRP